MRLSYGPTLFEASTMAAKQLLALAHGMNLLSLANVLELALSSCKQFCTRPRTGQFHSI